MSTASTKPNSAMSLNEIMLEEVVSLRGYLEYTQEHHALTGQQRGALALLNGLMLSQRSCGMCKAIKARHAGLSRAAKLDGEAAVGGAEMLAHLCTVHNHYLSRMND